MDESKKFINAKLVERRDTSEETAAFVFEPEGEITWEAGQYCTVCIQDGEKLLQRPYSIVSASFEKRVELFVELVREEEEGQMTPLLWKLKVGDVIRMRPEMRGTFTLDTESGRKIHFMIAESADTFRSWVALESSTNASSTRPSAFTTAMVITVPSKAYILEVFGYWGLVRSFGVGTLSNAAGSGGKASLLTGRSASSSAALNASHRMPSTSEN